MNLLLDTHIYLWYATDDKKLPQSVRLMIEDAQIVCISSISIWEIAIKASLGKLQLKFDLEELNHWITANGFTELPLTVKHAIAVHSLPLLHQDPFDRILIAQTISEPLKFVTLDAKLREYSELVEVVG